MALTEKKIQKALMNKFESHKYKFINVYYFDNESDWLSFLPTGYCYEIEVKISRSDFKADFKKPRHEVRTKQGSGNTHYIERRSDSAKVISDPDWDFCRNFPELVIAMEYNRYGSRRGDTDIRLSYTPYSPIEFREIKNLKLPNKFFYAVPEGMIKPEEVPDYAGLLYITEDLKVKKIKDGKFIHKDFLSPEKLFDKTYYVYESAIRDRLNKI
jgi:hypothetical protein